MTDTSDALMSPTSQLRLINGQRCTQVQQLGLPPPIRHNHQSWEAIEIIAHCSCESVQAAD